jgi:NADH dehydrogenase
MILITGATGLIGRHLIKALMDTDYQVRCFISPANAKHLSWASDAPNAPEVVIGTLLDEEILFQALVGVHVIIHLESGQWWANARQLERLELVGTRNLIAAARANRVGRMIVISHLGATPSSAFTLLRIKGQSEALVRDSGLAYTIIRSGFVFAPDDAFINHIAMNFSLNPFFTLMAGQGEVVLHPLYIDDLIKAMLISLEKLETVDETFSIGGAEYITYEDLLLTIMRLTGKYRMIIKMPPYVLRWLNTLSRPFVRRTLITKQWFDMIATNRTAPLGNMYHHFEFQPQRIEDTLLTYLPQKRLFLPALRYLFKKRPRGI